MDTVKNGGAAYVVGTFYRIIPLENYYDMKPALMERCIELGIKGTIILSCEGITATICSKSASSLDALCEFLHTDERLVGITYDATYCDYEPFLRVKVRLKGEIVNMGGYDVDMTDSGIKVCASEWDHLVASEGVAVIDVRNTYETLLGSFSNSVRPDTVAFSEFIPWFNNWEAAQQDKPRKLAICCTGGIRCEKAGAYMRAKGYEVYNLNNGILRYLEDSNNQSKTWTGNCFVFDDRVAVDANTEPNARCLKCGERPSIADLRSVSRAEVICYRCSGKNLNAIYHATENSCRPIEANT